MADICSNYEMIQRSQEINNNNLEVKKLLGDLKLVKTQREKDLIMETIENYNSTNKNLNLLMNQCSNGQKQNINVNINLNNEQKEKLPNSINFNFLGGKHINEAFRNKFESNLRSIKNENGEYIKNILLFPGDKKVFELYFPGGKKIFKEPSYNQKIILDYNIQVGGIIISEVDSYGEEKQIDVIYFNKKRRHSEPLKIDNGRGILIFDYKY